MDLETFIAEALTQICFGIARAKKQAGRAIATGIGATKGNISFEVVCTVGESKQNTKGSFVGFCLQVVGGYVNNKEHSSDSKEQFQKISFNVPYCPVDTADLIPQLQEK